MEAPLPALVPRQLTGGGQTPGQSTLAWRRRDCRRRFDQPCMQCRLRFWRWLGCLCRSDSGRRLLSDFPGIGLRTLSRGRLGVMRRRCARFQRQRWQSTRRPQHALAFPQVRHSRLQMQRSGRTPSVRAWSALMSACGGRAQRAPIDSTSARQCSAGCAAPRSVRRPLARLQSGGSGEPQPQEAQPRTGAVAEGGDAGLACGIS